VAKRQTHQLEGLAGAIPWGFESPLPHHPFIQSGYGDFDRADRTSESSFPAYNHYPLALTPGTRLGVYEITAPIGKGGMGEVYQAADTNLKRQVAIKVLPASVAGDAERLARFQREAEVLAALNHPNIAAIYGLERTPDVTALVMELVEGDDLSQRIARGPVPLDEALSVAKQIADALEAAHEQGIIHRDLKPANIKVRADGTVKVLDFGLAKATTPASDSSLNPSMSPTIMTPALMSNLGVILGTAAYMAPEQARGKAVDKRADIWAFGAVLFEMLTGRRAFDGEDISITLANVLKEDVQWHALPADVPAPVRRLLRRCLQKDPKKRLSAIADARLELEDAASNTGETPGSPIVPPDTASPWARALPWVVAAFAAIAAGLLGVNYLRQPAPERAIVRTIIPPPEQAAFDFDNTVGPAVLSPDGRSVAFSARSADGRVELWVRPLDNADARPIAGTDDASFPFWSPNSRSVGYYSSSRGRLERVDLTGGAPIVIARAGFVRGANWGRDNTVLFSASDVCDCIMATSISGGDSKVVVTSGNPRSPWMLPDGRHFLYQSLRSGQIRVASRDGKVDNVVTEATSNAIFADGYLLFMRDDTLIAQSFDLSTLALTGSPAAVAHGVHSLLGEGRGVFSASETGLLLYQNGASGSATSLAWFDGAGKRLDSVGDMGAARNVRLSPDGRLVEIALADVEGHIDLWTIDLATRARRRITFSREPNRVSPFAVWAPDGRALAYATTRDSKYAVAQSPVTGGAEQVLFTLSADPAGHFGFLRVTAWTNDGTTLCYSGENGGGLWTLALAAGPSGARTPAPLVIDPDRAQNARLSPSQRWVAYQAALGSGTVPGIFVETFPGGGARQQVAARGTLPVWSTDGRSFYYADDNMLTVVDVTEAEGTLRFGTPRRVMPVIVGRGFSYDVAKDGRILALTTSELRSARPLTLVQNWTNAIKDR
jgi:serine/threonine protein kinase